MAVYGQGYRFARRPRRFSPMKGLGQPSHIVSHPGTEQCTLPRLRRSDGSTRTYSSSPQRTISEQANIALADVQPAIMARRGEWPRAMAVIHHLQV